MRHACRISVLLALIFAGCGGRTTPRAGFVNQTQHSDAELWSLWKAAQQSLSLQIDLNPLQQERTNAAPQILPGDARVWSVVPHQLVVASQNDVSSSALYVATGISRPDPTGLILCPRPLQRELRPCLLALRAADDSIRRVLGIFLQQL